jgi:hypothetical protein
MNEPLLPKNEAELLTTLSKLPHAHRSGYARRLVVAHRDNPALLSLIQELLSTTLLPDRVPFPDQKQGDGYIKLLFPQSTASKRFFQRELGIDMACALGSLGVPALLEAILHPSVAGKFRAINACVSLTAGASDAEITEVYRKSVPATRESLHLAMKGARRVEALKSLNLWTEPSITRTEPLCVVLERDLASAALKERDLIWTRSEYLHHLLLV